MAAGNFFAGQFFGGGFFGALTPDTVPQPSGGYLHEGRRREPDELRRQREELGIIPREALATITDVAARQAEQLQTDAQKQYDELQRELLLRNIQLETRHIEAMNAIRERLIGEEIGRRLRERLRKQDEDELWMLVQIAAQA